MPQTEASLPNSLGLGFRVYRLAFGPEQVMRGHVTLEDPRQQGSTLTYRQRLCCKDPTGFRVQVFRSVCKFSYNDHEDSESDDACHYSWLRDPSLSTNISPYSSYHRNLSRTASGMSGWSLRVCLGPIEPTCLWTRRWESGEGTLTKLVFYAFSVLEDDFRT